VEEHLSAPSPQRRVLDHAANEPESPRRTGTSYERELERVTRARTYFDDHDPINRAIRRDPTRSMLIAAGVGFVFALLVR
jgi:hypothetical protein